MQHALPPLLVPGPWICGGWLRSLPSDINVDKCHEWDRIASWDCNVDKGHRWDLCLLMLISLDGCNIWSGSLNQSSTFLKFILMIVTHCYDKCYYLLLLTANICQQLVDHDQSNNSSKHDLLTIIILPLYQSITINLLPIANCYLLFNYCQYQTFQVSEAEVWVTDQGTKWSQLTG